MGRYVARASTVAATVGGSKTVLQITAGAADRMKITEVGVTFDGTSASAIPVTVQLMRQTSAGTGGTTVTPLPMEQADGAAHATAQSGPTTEPTYSDILREWRVPPSTGLIVQFPMDYQPVVGLSGSIAVVVTVASGQSAVDCTAYLEWTE